MYWQIHEFLIICYYTRLSTSDINFSYLCAKLMKTDIFSVEPIYLYYIFFRGGQLHLLFLINNWWFCHAIWLSRKSLCKYMVYALWEVYYVASYEITWNYGRFGMEHLFSLDSQHHQKRRCSGHNNLVVTLSRFEIQFIA